MTIAILITDQTDAGGDRCAVVTADTVAPVVDGWLDIDGMIGRPSVTVGRLVAALRRGDWNAVHALADHLTISVDVVA